VQHDITETIDSILLTCNEPRLGLTESEIAAAKEIDSQSSVLEYIRERPALMTVIAAVSATCLSVIVYYLKNKK